MYVKFGYPKNDLFYFCTFAFGYGIEIYANTDMKNINKQVILNNKILRNLQNVSRFFNMAAIESEIYLGVRCRAY